MTNPVTFMASHDRPGVHGRDGALATLVVYLGWPGETGCDEVGGFGVGTGDPGGVDLERGGSAAAVAETPRHGTQIDATGEQLGGAVVLQRMQMSVDAEISGHLRVSVRDPVRIAVPPVVERVGEHECVIVEGGAEFGAADLRALFVGVRITTVSWSSLITRIWWVLVSLRIVVPLRRTRLRRMVSKPEIRSTCSQASATSSPRRAPMMKVSQTKVPQSASCSHAALAILAASPAEGGSGCGAGCGAAGRHPAG